MIPAGLKRGEADEDEQEKGKPDSRDENTNPPAKNSTTSGSNPQPHIRHSRGPSPLVPLLMKRIRDYFDGGDPQDLDAELDPELALQLLEASSGDIDVAAAFFWDNFLASASRFPPGKGQQDNSPFGKRKRSDASSSASNRAAARKSPPHRGHDLEGKRRHPPPPPVLAVNNNNQVDVEDDMEEADDIPEREANPDAIAGSVSVSDDEGAGIWRTERRRRQPVQNEDAVHRNIGVGRLTRNVSNGAELPVHDGADNDDSTRALQIRDCDDADPGMQTQADNDDDEAHLSDDDWLTGKSTGIANPHQPSKKPMGSFFKRKQPTSCQY
ncbi:hypothetical protein MHU86_12856 [Fragilaria crotonensis]|nr:hypothetical protein MHU86_12856 [Fragilaria crotonensis]